MAEDAKPSSDEKEVDDKEKKDGETPPPPHYEETSHETFHTVEIGGFPVKYTATAGRLLLTEEELRALIGNDPDDMTGRRDNGDDDEHRNRETGV